MKKYCAIVCWLSPQATWAHHTKDHLMLAEDAGRVIALTHEGASGGWTWLIWAGVAILLLVGLSRGWRNRGQKSG